MVKLGLDPIKTWDYTPAEIGLLCEQTLEKRKYDAHNLITLAWHTEAFARQKRLPRLETLLKEIDSGKRKDNADDILKAMARAKGVIIK